MMIADINKYVYESNPMSFAVDTRIYAKINNVSDWNPLLQHLNHMTWHLLITGL